MGAAVNAGNTPKRKPAYRENVVPEFLRDHSVRDDDYWTLMAIFMPSAKWGVQ
jgi:hypothetical protein